MRVQKVVGHDVPSEQPWHSWKHLQAAVTYDLSTRDYTIRNVGYASFRALEMKSSAGIKMTCWSAWRRIGADPRTFGLQGYSYEILGDAIVIIVSCEPTLRSIAHKCNVQ